MRQDSLKGRTLEIETPDGRKLTVQNWERDDPPTDDEIAQWASQLTPAKEAMPLAPVKVAKESIVSDLDRFINAITQKESGGNYKALGKPVKKDRAYGKYQIMGSNIPSWTKAALGRSLTPQQFLNDPAAQDAVARWQLTNYFNKYGPEGAAKAWYGGEGNARTNSNKRNRSDDGTEFPSLNEYAASISQLMGQPDPNLLAKDQGRISAVKDVRDDKKRKRVEHLETRIRQGEARGEDMKSLRQELAVLYDQLNPGAMQQFAQDEQVSASVQPPNEGRTERMTRLMSEFKDLNAKLTPEIQSIAQRDKALEAEKVKLEKDTQSFTQFFEAKRQALDAFAAELKQEYANIDHRDPKSVARYKARVAAYDQAVEQADLEVQAKIGRITERENAFNASIKAHMEQVGRVTPMLQRQEQIEGALKESTPQAILQRFMQSATVATKAISSGKQGPLTPDALKAKSDTERLVREHVQPMVDSLPFRLWDLYGAASRGEKVVRFKGAAHVDLSKQGQKVDWSNPVEAARKSSPVQPGMKTEDALAEFEKVFGTRDLKVIDQVAKWTHSRAFRETLAARMPALLSETIAAAKANKKYVTGLNGDLVPTATALRHAKNAIGTDSLKGLAHYYKVYGDVIEKTPEAEWADAERGGAFAGTSLASRMAQEREYRRDPTHWKQSIAEQIVGIASRGIFEPASAVDDLLRNFMGDPRTGEQLPQYHQILRQGSDFVAQALTTKGAWSVGKSALKAGTKATLGKTAFGNAYREFAKAEAEKLTVGNLAKLAVFEEVAEEIPEGILAIKQVMRQQDLSFWDAAGIVAEEYKRQLLSVEWMDPKSKMTAAERFGSFLNQFSIVAGSSMLAFQSPSVKRAVVAEKLGLDRKDLSAGEVERLSVIVDGLDAKRTEQKWTAQEYKNALKAAGNVFMAYRDTRRIIDIKEDSSVPQEAGAIDINRLPDQYDEPALTRQQRGETPVDTDTPAFTREGKVIPEPTQETPALTDLRAELSGVLKDSREGALKPSPVPSNKYEQARADAALPESALTEGLESMAARQEEGASAVVEGQKAKVTKDATEPKAQAKELAAIQDQGRKIATDRPPFWQARAKPGGEVGPNGEHYKGGQFIANFPETIKGAGQRTRKLGEATNRANKAPLGVAPVEAGWYGGGATTVPVERNAWYGGKVKVNPDYNWRISNDPESAKAHARQQVAEWNQLVDLANKEGSGVEWHPTKKHQGVLTVDILRHPSYARPSDIARWIANGDAIPAPLLQRAKEIIEGIDIDRYQSLVEWNEKRNGRQPKPKTTTQKPSKETEGTVKTEAKAEPTERIADFGEKPSESKETKPDAQTVQRQAGVVESPNRSKDRGRAAIVDAAEGIATPQPSNRIPAGLESHLSPHQKQAANLIAESRANGKGGFVLADAPGVGKTRTIIASAVSMKRSGAKLLIVTESKTIIGDSFRKDAAVMGIAIDVKAQVLDGDIQIVTVDGFRKADLSNFDTIIFDESQKAAGLDSETGARLQGFQGHVTYSSATPFDSFDKVLYLLPRMFGQTPGRFLDSVGGRLVQRKGRGMEMVFDDGGAALYERLPAMFEDLARSGLMVSRYIPFQGGAQSMSLSMDVRDNLSDGMAEPMSLREAEEGLSDAYKQKLRNLKRKFNSENRGSKADPRTQEEYKEKRRQMLEQKSNELRRLAETYKATPELVRDIQARLRSGGQVVIYANKVSDALRFHYSVGFDEEGDFDTGGGGVLSYTRPSFYQQIQDQLKKARISYVTITGENTTGKGESVDAFQSGRAKVVIINQAGTTGINLNDTVGNAPRTLYVAGEVPNAIQLDQLLGRVSRINNASDAQVVYVTTDSEGDARAEAARDRRMAVLRAFTRGERDADVSFESPAKAQRPAATPGGGQMVTYTTNKGKEIQVRLVETRGDKVVLELSNGKQFTAKAAQVQMPESAATTKEKPNERKEELQDERRDEVQAVSETKPEAEEEVAPEPGVPTIGEPVVRKSAEGFEFTETRVDPKQIGVYPKMQFKKIGITDTENQTAEWVKNVETYDQATGGPLTVWQTRDGKLWVMNGHHRRHIAINTNEPDVPIRIFKESSGIDFTTARALGALQNIKDGKGTAIDAATVIRDLGYTTAQLRSFGVDTKTGLARDARSLLKLVPEALTFVEEGTVSEQAAAGVADARLDPARQVATMKELARGELMTRQQGESLAEIARNQTPSQKGDPGQSGLFESAFDEEFTLAEQARIADLTLRRLARNRQLLVAITKGKAVGETVVDANAQESEAGLMGLAREIMASDPDTQRILEEEASAYAKAPTRGNLEKAATRVVESATEAAQRRVQGFNSGTGAKSAGDRVSGRSGSGSEVSGRARAQAQPRPELKPDVLTPEQSGMADLEPETELTLEAPTEPKAKRPAAPKPKQSGIDLDLSSPEAQSILDILGGNDLQEGRSQFSEDQTKTPAFKKWFGDSKVVDKDGKPLVVYAGHMNTAVFGDRYRAKNATSGAFYTTDDPGIASNYAMGKFGQMEDYLNGSQYNIQLERGKPFNKTIWDVRLSDEQLAIFQEWFSERYGEAGLDAYLRENARYESEWRTLLYRGGERNLGAWWKFMEYMGDTIAYPESGGAPLFERQQLNDFEELMQKAGIAFQDRTSHQPGVIPLYLSVQNPIYTDKPFPADLMAALKAKVGRRKPKDDATRFQWTRDYPLPNWVRDIESGNEFWATHIPKEALPVIRQFGYDGVLDTGGKMGGEAHHVVVFFNPSQAKSAIANRGTFNPEDPSILREDRIFYSKLEQVAKDKLPNKGSASQMLKTLEGAGVKAEELQWTGVQSLLESLGDQPITKAELLQHLTANQVVVEEVFSRENKFKHYALSGGENYRELALSLPMSEASTRAAQLEAEIESRQEQLDQEIDEFNVSDDQDAWPDGYFDNERAAIRQLHQELGDSRRAAKGVDYRVPPAHGFGDSQADTNRLAHIRFDDRTGPNGEKVLHIAEIQSDWHQEGRKKGYAIPVERAEAMQATAVEKLAKALRDMALSEGTSEAFAAQVGKRVAGQYLRGASRMNDIPQDVAAAYDEVDAAKQAMSAAMQGVPDAPFKKNWQELAFKRILRYAAENGYDQITWDTGATNADRYDLSKQVSRLEYDSEEQRLSAYDLNNQPVQGIPSTVAPQDLPDIIGKEAAEKLLNEPTKTRKRAGEEIGGKPVIHVLSGIDLKVGGEGMKGFYDQMLPAFVNKYVKRFGGKVTSGAIDAGEYKVMRDSHPERPYRLERTTSPDIVSRHRTSDEAWNEAERLGSTPVHQLILTPDLKRSVMTEGQPLFEAPQLRFGKGGLELRKGDNGKLARQAANHFTRAYGGTVVGRAFSRALATRGHANLKGQNVRSVDGLAALAQIYRDARAETGRLVFVRNGRVVYETALSLRLPGMTRFAPIGVDDIAHIKSLIGEHGADGVYLLHNHPSGDPHPSEVDAATTQRLMKAIPEIRGHVVIDSNKYATIDANGNARIIAKDFGPDKLLAADVDHPLLYEKVRNTADVASIGAAIMEENRLPVFVGLASDAKTRLFLRTGDTIIKRLLKGGPKAAAFLSKIQKDNGVRHLFLVIPDLDAVPDLLKRADITLALHKNLIEDIVDMKGRSLRHRLFIPQSKYEAGRLFGTAGQLYLNEPGFDPVKYAQVRTQFDELFQKAGKTEQEFVDFWSAQGEAVKPYILAWRAEREAKEQASRMRGEATGLANQVQTRQGIDAEKGNVTKKGQAQTKGEEILKGKDDPIAFAEDLALKITTGDAPFTWQNVGILLAGDARLFRAVVEAGSLVESSKGTDQHGQRLAEYEAAKLRRQTYLDDVQKGKTEWHNVGMALQEGTDILTGEYREVIERVLAEAERMKGSNLSEKEKAEFESLVKELETVRADLAKAQADLAQKAAMREYQNARKERASRRAKLKIEAEIDDLWKEFRKQVAPLGILPNPAAFGTLAKIAKAHAKLYGAANFDAYVDKILGDAKEHFGEIERDDVLRAITGDYPKDKRTLSDAARERAELVAQARAELKSAKRKADDELKAALDESKRLLKEAEKAGREEVKRQARRIAENAHRERAEKARQHREEEELLKKVDKAFEKRRKQVKSESLTDKRAKLYERIGKLQAKIDAGDFTKSKKEPLPPELLDLKAKEQDLRNIINAHIKAAMPKTVAKRVDDFGRANQLFNLFSRFIDVTANTTKVASFIALSPGRSMLTTLLFSKTPGRERMLTPGKLWRTQKGAPARLKRQARSVMSGADAETIEKYGEPGGFWSRFAGLTDVPFKDLYTRLAMDDIATTYAESKGGTRKEKDLLRQEAFLQLVEESPSGPLSAAEVAFARDEVANDWALRQTFNIDNLASKSVEALKSGVGQWIQKSGGNTRKSRELADLVGLFISMPTRFTKVIANVGFERANYSALGVVEGLARLVYSKIKSAGDAPAPGMFAQKPGSIPPEQARLIADLLTKGLVGMALMAFGESIKDWLTEDDEVLEGKIGTTAGGTKFIKWTFGKNVFGGFDAEQLGGLLAPVLAGATKKMIEDADLTEKQKVALQNRYFLEHAFSSPLSGAIKDAARSLSGERDFSEYLGSLAARNIIPGMSREVAERMDEMATGVELRKSKGLKEELFKRIPRLRESLEANQPKQKKAAVISVPSTRSSGSGGSGRKVRTGSR